MPAQPTESIRTIRNPPLGISAWQRERERHDREQRNERMKFSAIESHPTVTP